MLIALFLLLLIILQISLSPVSPKISDFSLITDQYQHISLISEGFLKFLSIARFANKWNKCSLLTLTPLVLKGVSPADFRKILNFYCLCLWSSLSAGSVESISLILYQRNTSSCFSSRTNQKILVEHFLFYVVIITLIWCQTDTIVELLFVPHTFKKFLTDFNPSGHRFSLIPWVSLIDCQLFQWYLLTFLNISLNIFS